MSGQPLRGQIVRVLTCHGRLYAAQVLDGPRMLRKRSFSSYKVVPVDGGKARWVSVISIFADVGQPPTIPADADRGDPPCGVYT